MLALIAEFRKWDSPGRNYLGNLSGVENGGYHPVESRSRRTSLMGDKITQTAQHAAVLRARFLKAALESGAPPSLSHADSEPDTTREAFDPCWEHNPEIQRAHLEQLVEGATEAITILDANHRVVRINSEFTRMFGYTAAESLGQKVDSLIVPPEQRAEAEAIQQTL